MDTNSNPLTFVSISVYSWFLKVSVSRPHPGRVGVFNLVSRGFHPELPKSAPSGAVTAVTAQMNSLESRDDWLRNYRFLLFMRTYYHINTHKTVLF